jgi:hypothetical protein
MDVLRNLPLPQLPLARYRLVFRALDAMRLPDYAGSAWRGAFGHRLKKLVCVTREPHCPNCLLYRSCAYPYIFETPPDPDVGKLRKYTAAPHPFVLCPGAGMCATLAAGDERMLELTLFGSGNRQLPYIVHALDQAARHGLGKHSGRLELLRVEQHAGADDWPVVYRPDTTLQPLAPVLCELPPCPPRPRLQLHTPLRLRADGRNVGAQEFHFKALFSNLLRRISLLTAFHGDTPLETDFAGLTRAAGAVGILDKELHWHDWTRYSSRQNSLMQLGGLLGTIELDGARLAPFWPYLWLGQWTHAGKGTSMGLGKYRIDPRD